MSFQTIPPVERWDTIIDVAFRRGKERVGKLRKVARKNPKEEFRIKFRVVRDVICQRLEKVVNDFPMVENLTPFYEELVKTTMDYGMMKKSFGALLWGSKQVDKLWREFNGKLTKTGDETKFTLLQKAYYGRVNSVVKRMGPYLSDLEEARKIMRDYPSVKQMQTAVIFGFPNVGKTTLLFKMTGSKAEIKAYAFTTKTINAAYIKGDVKIQLFDTPGTLNRFEKMNPIERQAYLAEKYVAQAIIYVFDPVEEYPMSEQEKLFHLAENLRKPLFVYVSKVDIEPERANELALKYNGITDSEELKKKLIEFFKENGRDD